MNLHCNWLSVRVATFALCCLSLWPHAAQAAEAIGWVQDKSGVVTIHSRGKQTPATLGAGVLSQDKITTARASRVQIMFKDKSILALSEMSECLIADVQLDAGNKSAARLGLKFLKGVFGMLLGGVSEHNPDGFSAQSPQVALGIRGTEFASAVDSAQELHGLYKGGPVVVTARHFKKSGAASAPQNTEELCDAMDDTVSAMERAYRSKRGAGQHSEADTYDAKAEKYEQLMEQYNCE